MKITSLIAALVVTAALTAFGQEGVVQDVKHGAKKAGETIKDGLETAGEKTKEAAKTVGRKTKETAETVATKNKRNREWHSRKSRRDFSKDTSEVQQDEGPNHRRTDDRSRIKHASTKPDAVNPP